MKFSEKLFPFIFNQEKHWSIKTFLMLIIIYFLLILILALPEGRSTQLVTSIVPNSKCIQKMTGKSIQKPCNPVLRITASSTAKDFLDFFGQGDPGSYTRGGLLLAGQEWGGAYNTIDLSLVKRLKLMNLIGFGIWPPGMYVLNALPLMVNIDAPLGLYQVVIAATLWAIAFALIASLLRLRLRLFLSVTLPALLMFFPLFHYFIRFGVMYSETYCTALMVIGFTLLTTYSYKKSSKSLMMIAGLCFAASSFMRSQMLPVAVGVTIILGVLFLIKICTKKSKTSEVSNTLSVATLLFLVSFYTPVAGYMIFNRGALFHAEYVWTLPFEALDPLGSGGFLVSGGMRAACEANVARCKYLQKKSQLEGGLPHPKTEVLKSFIWHPLNFSLYKLPIAWRFWNEDSGTKQAIIYRWDNILILTIFILSILYMNIRRYWLFLGFTISTISLLFGPPFLLHFEVRYFFITKAYILFLPFFIFIINQQINNKKSPAKLG